MTINSYDIGDLVRCSAIFNNGNDVDPTVVTFRLRRKNDTAVKAITSYVYGTDLQVIRDSVGHYHVDVAPGVAGDWYYRFEGTGTAQAAGEQLFKISVSQFK